MASRHWAIEPPRRPSSEVCGLPITIIKIDAQIPPEAGGRSAFGPEAHASIVGLHHSPSTQFLIPNFSFPKFLSLQPEYKKAYSELFIFIRKKA